LGLEDGATGYRETKQEACYDNGFFDFEAYSQPIKSDKSAIMHDHTYGAPPGGQPHVRKMDIKVNSSIFFVFRAILVQFHI